MVLYLIFALYILDIVDLLLAVTRFNYWLKLFIFRKPIRPTFKQSVGDNPIHVYLFLFKHIIIVSFINNILKRTTTDEVKTWYTWQCYIFFCAKIAGDLRITFLKEKFSFRKKQHNIYRLTSINSVFCFFKSRVTWLHVERDCQVVDFNQWPSDHYLPVFHII